MTVFLFILIIAAVLGYIFRKPLNKARISILTAEAFDSGYRAGNIFGRVFAGTPNESRGLEIDYKNVYVKPLDKEAYKRGFDQGTRRGVWEKQEAAKNLADYTPSK